MFIDQVEIEVKSGDGGDGIIAFRREKHVPLGGPAGGSGGRGGDIIFKVDEGLRTLLDFSYNKSYEADKGENGKSKSMHGANSESTVLSVPQGTAIYDALTGDLVIDMTAKDQEYIIAKGGRGGRGNVELARSGSGGLEIKENGEPGKQLRLRLELKLISDVGLVGLPSVGKSTLISAVTKAKPKVAAYHFTTLTPKLGVAQTNDKRSFVIADLPGLIKGASLGKGLGHQFLRHIERTKILLHVLDMGAFEQRDPLEDYEVINEELKSYSYNLENRKQIVVANKMDLPDAEENLQRFKAKYPKIDVVEVSTVTNQGLDLLLNKTADLLEVQEQEVQVQEEIDEVKIYKFEKEEDYIITIDSDGTFVLGGERIEKLFAMTDFSTYDNTRRFANILRKMGVDDALRKYGAKDGDIIRISDFEFEFQD